VSSIRKFKSFFFSPELVLVYENFQQSPPF